MGLFQLGDFKLHSGAASHWKIECDALSDEDWEALAVMAVELLSRLPFLMFGYVEGIPRGGLKLAAALEKHVPTRNRQNRLLLVDDVLTTGRSMEEAYQRHTGQGPASRPSVMGLVVFARGPCPSWITPLFQMTPPLGGK